MASVSGGAAGSGTFVSRRPETLGALPATGIAALGLALIVTAAGALHRARTRPARSDGYG